MTKDSMKKAIFLDRDGTINIDKRYVYKIEDFEFIPKTTEAVKLMQDSGYLLMIITNQSGIGKGYYCEEDFKKLNNHMLRLFLDNGINISKVYHCPHDPNKGCDCRKPGTKLIKLAEKEFGIELKESYVIGDKTSDIAMGKGVACKTILVKTGKAGKDKLYDVKPDFTAKDLYAAAKLISQNESKKA